MALERIDAAASAWRPSGDLTVFLSAGEPVERAVEVADRLASRPEVIATEVRSPDDALAELRRLSDFAEALSALDANPMPALVIVRLSPAGAARLDALQQELSTLPGVDWVQVDKRWLERLEALIDVARRTILLAAAILAIAVLLVVGNTIRLEISERRDEIVILKLLGATDAAVRRPFLYIGLWYGVIGALLSLALVFVCLSWLQPAVAELAASYGNDLVLTGPGARGAFWLVAYGAALGWVGALLASSRHLKRAEPK
jgi:cell division transport system permease protein